MKYKPTGHFDDSQLRGTVLLAVMDVLFEAEVPLTISQIQYRLGANRGLTYSKEEIERHLLWGSNQPNATTAPMIPRRDNIKRDMWTVQPKRPITKLERIAAGPPPFEPSTGLWVCAYCREQVSTGREHHCPGSDAERAARKISEG